MAKQLVIQNIVLFFSYHFMFCKITKENIFSLRPQLILQVKPKYFLELGFNKFKLKMDVETHFHHLIGIFSVLSFFVRLC